MRFYVLNELQHEMRFDIIELFLNEKDEIKGDASISLNKIQFWTDRSLFMRRSL